MASRGPTLPLEELLERARAGAVQAGRELSGRFGRAVETRMKGEDDPVTEADLASARVLEEALLRPPVAEWLCEESKDRPQGATFWAVDPMDGTRSFLQGERDFTVSIGLVDSGQLVLGVVHNPMTGELYSAVRGQGLSFEGPGGEKRPLLPLEEAPLSRSRLVLSRTELARGQLAPFEPAAASVTPCGSIAYKLARVASGEFLGTVSRTPKGLWDIAAGALFVEEAGGVATDLYGERLDGRAYERYGVIAAAPGLHAELRALLVTHGLDRPV
jgi:myo-inositol-1(or 4)-monophosphatase